MTALILDAGALIAIDSNDRAMFAKLKVAQKFGMELRTTGIIIAQVWRDSNARQANLARMLNAIDVRAVDSKLGREAGILLGKARLSDPADATIVAVANTGDRIMTSDSHDIGQLVAVSGRTVIVIPC